MNTEIFPIIFIGLFAGHHAGDYWIQTDHQAITKGKPGAEGIRACLAHVTGLTLTKLIFVGSLLSISGLAPSPFWFLFGVFVDASSHYWADRRTTLEKLAKVLRKSTFYQMGKDTVHTSSPPGTHVGVGSHALDQAFHLVFLVVGSVLMSM
ncbi:hypothetical protein [Rhodococcus qingshengii]|uniref:hypothetical protein n=1 Tax=Rhodococcus qingshengii TaxID=334542 RepID=UPI0035E0762D